MQNPKHEISDSDYHLQSLISKLMLQNQERCGNCDNCMFGKLKCRRARQNKLSLSPIKSTYLASYKIQDSISNKKFSVPSNQQSTCMIVSDSAYRKEYLSRQMEDVPKPIKPRNNIKLGGPNYFVSNYAQSFPQNNKMPIKEQKIVNPQCWPTYQQLKMNGCSSYRQSYKMNRPHIVSPIKRQGSLRVNGSFIGETSYKNEYLPYIAAKRTESLKPHLKYEPLQFKSVSSTYKSEYLSHIPRDRKQFFGATQ